MTRENGVKPSGTPKRWNLFARELEDILANHGYRLGQLDNRTSINPAKVQRLQLSLSQEHPKQFPLLPREEIDEIVRVFQFDRDEQLRLRAAVLVTALERVLMDRLDPENALLAAEQIWPTVLDAVRRHAHEARGIGALRGGASTMNDPHESEGFFEGVLEAIDRATLALHLSYEVESLLERLAQVRVARDGFATALEELEAMPADAQARSEWGVWRAEAQRGLDAAKQKLSDWIEHGE